MCYCIAKQWRRRQRWFSKSPAVEPSTREARLLAVSPENVKADEGHRTRRDRCRRRTTAVIDVHRTTEQTSPTHELNNSLRRVEQFKFLVDGRAA